jgi:hypothetical protein
MKWLILLGLVVWPVVPEAQTLDAADLTLLTQGTHWIIALLPYLLAYFFLSILQNIAENVRRSTNLLAMTEAAIAALNGTIAECTETLRSEIEGVRVGVEEIQDKLETSIESAIQWSATDGELGKILKGAADSVEYTNTFLAEHLPTLVGALQDVERKIPDPPPFDDYSPWEMPQP